MEFNIKTIAGVGDFIYYPTEKKIAFDQVREIRINIKDGKMMVVYNDRHKEENVFASVEAVLNHLKYHVDMEIEKFKNLRKTKASDIEYPDDEDDENPKPKRKYS